MCLAVPGKIVAVRTETGTSQRLATVDFQGSQVEVSLALTPDAAEGDWVLVHAGFAIALLEEAEARETWRWLAEAEVVDGAPAEFAGPGPGEAGSEGPT